ncbi:MAG: hypothetical protein AAF432_05105 [Planctomycetota bacterium]
MNRRLIVVISAVIMAMAVTSGCNIVTPIAYIIEGPGTIDAEYELADVPTVVFVDDRANILSPIMLRRNIADTVSKELMTRAGLSTTIRPQDALTVAKRLDTNEEPISMDRIARGVGAEQIVYVQMRSWKRTPDGFTPRPTASCTVQVLDVVEGRQAYPIGEDGQPIIEGRSVVAMLPAMNESAFESRAAIRQLQELLAQQTGTEIAKLFYRHERVDLGGNLQSR